jgi:hypothetical protein
MQSLNIFSPLLMISLPHPGRRKIQYPEKINLISQSSSALLYHRQTEPSRNLPEGMANT